MFKKVLWLLISLSFFGCATLGDVMSSIQSPMDRSGSDSSGEAVSKSDEAPEEITEESSTASALDMGMFLGPELQFSLLYATYFFMGGYGFGDDNFRDGEGVKWSITTNNDNGETLITRARLKTLPEGSAWWAMRGVSNGEEYYYEMVIDADMNVLKARYKNKDTGQIDEFTLEPSTEEDEYESFSSSDYEPFVVGNVQIKTKAGSFKADHIVMEDPESNSVYEYWIAERVPGRAVKYHFENPEEDQTFDGELVDVRGGYRTELDSY